MIKIISQSFPRTGYRVGCGGDGGQVRKKKSKIAFSHALKDCFVFVWNYCTTCRSKG